MSYYVDTMGNVWQTWASDTTASLGTSQIPITAPYHWTSSETLSGTSTVYPPKPIIQYQLKKVKHAKSKLGKQTKMRLPSSKELNDLIGK